MLFILFLTQITLVSQSFCSPVYIKTAGKLYNQNEGDNVYSIHSKKDQFHEKNLDNYDKENKKHYLNEDNSKRYGENSNELSKKIYDELDDTQHYKKNYAQNEEGEDIKKGRKKGHHKTGFHTTYHKDESGTNTTFFDDESNEDGRYAQNANREHFKKIDEHNNLKKNVNNEQHNAAKTEHGIYDNKNNYQIKKGNNHDLTDHNYKSEMEKYGKKYYDDQKYNQERYYDQMEPRYHDNYHSFYQPMHHNRYTDFHMGSFRNTDRFYNNMDRNDFDMSPRYEKKVITIFEDPRYVGNYEGSFGAYQDESVQIEVRHPNEKEHYGYMN